MLLQVLDTDRAFCPQSAFISSVFLHVLRKLTDTRHVEQYHWKPEGGSVAVTAAVSIAEIRKVERIKPKLSDDGRNDKRSEN